MQAYEWMTEQVLDQAITFVFLEYSASFKNGLQMKF